MNSTARPLLTLQRTASSSANFCVSSSKSILYDNISRNVPVTTRKRAGLWSFHQVNFFHSVSSRKLSQIDQKILPTTAIPCIRQFCQKNVEKEVIFESIQDKGLITLNRPKVLNVLNLSMLTKLLAVLREWEATKKIVIIKGQGGKAFCAGGDVVSVTQSLSSGTGYFKQCALAEYSVNGFIGSLRIPYIALIDGITMGGGAGVSVHGDYRVATEKTLFAMPETAIGLFPDIGASYFLPRLSVAGRDQGRGGGGIGLGLFLGLTGHRLKGVDNMRAGIATHMCSSSMLPNLEKDLISIDTSGSATASSSIPETIEKILQHYTDACPESKKVFSLEPKLDKIDRIFGSANSIEDIVARLKDDEDNDDWSLNVLKILNRMSPTSLKITFQLLHTGAKLSLTECLQMENRLASHCADAPDFLEGVRALLIDKDQKPRWNPSKLEDVSQAYVDSFFVPLPKDQELYFEN